MAVHVVVGAGPIGTGVAQLLAAEGQQVRVVSRRGAGPEHPLVERIALDARDAAALRELAAGAAAVYNCVNPPYHRWPQEWPPIAASLLAAAEGGVLATCSNLYGYGPVDRPMTEDLPLATTGRKGRVRVRMWQDALAAHEAGRVRVTEVRPSSYLSPGSGAAFDGRVVPALLRGRSPMWFGPADVPHSFSWTGDVAFTLVAVAADERAHGRAWHAPSPPARTRQAVVDDLAAALGVPSRRLRRIPSTAVRALGLVSPQVREFGEVMHQFERPWVLDSGAAERVLGLSPTPWADVVAAVARSYRERSVTSQAVTA